MKTNLCQMLGIEHPIIAAPMGPDLTGPELVAAVSNAGGLGEIGLAGMAAAITASVHHATGVRVRELPVKIENLLV